MTSRPPPPAFEPCAFDGVRYEPDYATTREAPKTRTGGLAAFDEASGRRLWSVVLWTTVEDVRGLSIPPRFLRRVVRGPQPDELIVEDEFGVRYLVDCSALTARSLGRAGSPEPPGGSA